MARRVDPAILPLAGALDQRVTAGLLYTKLTGNRVKCTACAHRCTILPGLDGICRVRSNRSGELVVPRGYVGSLQVDPIEKKPFFHVLPGAEALSFGMLGCDLHCAYCQNWMTSQVMRDPSARSAPRDIEPEELVSLALQRETPVMVSTYNEPLITAEWAVEVFAKAKAAGIVCGFVSNGNATPEVLEFIQPYVSLYKIDLKGFKDARYRELGGKLHSVVETIKRVHAMGFWLEVVTLLIPGINDDPAEIRDLTQFLVSVSPDIPWHVTAFHGDYQMSTTRDTLAFDLIRAAAIGRDSGLRYVYAGNLPGEVGGLEDTRCPSCGATVIARRGYRVAHRAQDDEGRCLACRTPIAGYWKA